MYFPKIIFYFILRFPQINKYIYRVSQDHGTSPFFSLFLSNLGPLLFILFINSLTALFRTASYLLFADDLKIYLKIENESDCVQLQLDLNRAVKWSEENKLFFNISKCAVISYSRKNDSVLYNYVINERPLTRVHEVRDLGVTFDKRLTFNNHIIKIVNKAMQVYGFIVRHTRDFTDPNCIKQLYMSLVRSLLEYASVIWSPFYLCYKYQIEKIQNKIVRYMYYKESKEFHFNISVTWLCEKYGLMRLEKRREMINILYLFKTITGIADNSEFLIRINFLVPSYNTRQANTFYLSTVAMTNLHSNSPLYRLCHGYNRLEVELDIYNNNYDTFKKRLAELF